MALVAQKMENTSHTPMKPRFPYEVAVIILNWNGRALLEEYLPQVLETTDPALSRVIVADNGSNDDSIAYLESNFGNGIDIIRFDKNYGFAEGYNKAIAMCENYRYVVLLNSDVATTKGWDRELYNFLEDNGGYVACQPKILAYKDRERFEYAGACGGMLDRDGYPFCRGRIFDRCEIDRGQYDTPAEVHWASGACLMVKRDEYLITGGLDKEFFAHMEEIDLCWRLRLGNNHIACVPSATVYHLGGGSLPAENPFKTYLNFRNSLLMLHKNLPDADRRWALIRRRLLDTVAWAKFVLTFDMKNAASIVKAHRDFARMRHKYTVHPKDNLLKSPEAYRNSILMQFFVFGRKTYSALKGLPESYLP